MKNIKIYEKNILLYNDKHINTNYNKCNQCIEYKEIENGCELTISVNPNSHVIDNAVFDISNNDKYLQGVMNAFCEIIRGLPILEAQDHSVLRLENLLRDDSMVHSIKGVIMPSNSCEIFKTPLHLIRNIYKQYCETQNYQPIVNTYSPNAITKWKNLDIKERENIVSENIATFCKKNNIDNYDIKLIGDMRVEFFADKEIYPSLAKLLFDMETSISKELGFSLEIMFVEKQDANRKRKN
ncbi:MAG: hypothetical protein K8R39_00435 [Arcobacteraceae bacterium]|nr:hypothetical protein [Arcobacteraceae bacterium]